MASSIGCEAKVCGFSSSFRLATSCYKAEVTINPPGPAMTKSTAQWPLINP